MSLELQSPQVLLVDDNPANLLALAAVLRPIGATLVEADSGARAIELVRQNWFAAILLDVQMPGMDGFETAAQIRRIEHGREVPIIFLTAFHRGDTYVLRGYEAGAADYISKPFDERVVQARVRAFVELFRQREGQRRERLEAALNFVPALVSILRVPGFACEFGNVEFRRSLGGREVIGRSVAELGLTAEVIGLLDRVAATEQRATASERPMHVLPPGGPRGERVYNLTLQPLRGARGHADAILCFAVDVTEQVRVRRDLHRARIREEEATRAKDDLIAAMSRELRARPVSTAARRIRALREIAASDEPWTVRLDALSILVVDDEEEARLLLQEIFASCGAAVTCASSARDALVELRKVRPDLLISDISMPETDGYSLVQEVRRLSREEGGDTPAIALTAFSRAEDAARALAAGYQLHIAKPVDPRALLSSVTKLMARPATS